jgi:integrase
MEQVNKMKIKFPNSLFIFVNKKGIPYNTAPKRALETSKRKANIKDIGGFHIFRHTAGSYWLQGINYKGERIKPLRLEIISKLLGHRDTSTTERVYAKFCNDDIVKSLIEIEI